MYPAQPQSQAAPPATLAAEREETSNDQKAQDIYNSIANLFAAPKQTFDHYVHVVQVNKVKILLGVGVAAGVFLTVALNSLLYKLGIKTSETEKLNEMKNTLDKMANLLKSIQKTVSEPITLSQI